MAREATVRASLTIRAGNINYNSQPTGFSATVTGRKGPVPGAITVTTFGTDVDLSELTQPGLCRIQNLDTDNFVEYGIWDAEAELFFPLGELLPGEGYVLRLSRNLGIEWQQTGTGTSARTNTLRFKANTASVVVVVEAFEN